MKHHLPSPLALLVLLAAIPALTGLAHAQTRTPTSPFDRPESAAPSDAALAPIPSAPATTPPLVPSPEGIALPDPGRVAAPTDRTTLLPEGVSSSDGLTEAAVVARAGELGIGARRSDARVDAAEAAVRVARRGFVPRTSVGFRYTRLSSYAPGTIAAFDTAGCLADLGACSADPASFQRNVVLQQPILDQFALTTSVTAPISDYLGSQRHELAATRAEAEAAEANAEAAATDVEVAARSAYWELVRARAQHALATDSAALATRRRDETRDRRAQGVVTDVDVFAAEASVGAYAQLLEVSRTRVELAEESLRDLLELGPDASLALSVDLARVPSAPDASGAELRAEAESNAPAVIAARRTAEAADARVRAERTRMLPTLSASFNHTYANPNARIFPQTTSFVGTWDVGVQLAWSLDGALLAEARASQRRALANDGHLAADQAEQNARRAVTAAHGQLLAALANVEARDAAAASAERAASAIADRRRAGLATETDLRDSEAAHLRARLDLVDAVVEVHLAEARLLAALGNSSRSTSTSSHSEVR